MPVSKQNPSVNAGSINMRLIAETLKLMAQALKRKLQGKGIPKD